MWSYQVLEFAEQDFLLHCVNFIIDNFAFYSCSYGCNHESIARKKYNSVMCQQHEAFSISDSGLRVNLKWPFMGATPDRVVMCECCGTGACEIKVYNLRYYKHTLGMAENMERAPSNILATPIHFFFHSLYSVHFARKTKKT